MNIGASGKQSDQDVELNLASIIDCFTVLITYLLVTASFISLGMLDIAVPVRNSQVDQATPDLSLTIEIEEDGILKIKTEGKQNSTLSISAKDKSWDLDTLIKHLKSFQSKYPSLDSALIAVADPVHYQDVVKIIEKTKLVLAHVSLEGKEGK